MISCILTTNKDVYVFECGTAINLKTGIIYKGKLENMQLCYNYVGIKYNPARLTEQLQELTYCAFTSSGLLKFSKHNSIPDIDCTISKREMWELYSKFCEDYPKRNKMSDIKFFHYVLENDVYNLGVFQKGYRFYGVSTNN